MPDFSGFPASAQNMAAMFNGNSPTPSALTPFRRQQTFNTPLGQGDEMAFRQWVQTNKIPFNPDAAQSDYDMRGFWRGLQQQHPMAQTAVNPNDNRLHFPDYWKTPLHQTFSNESQWAPPNAPQWINDSQLAAPSGRIRYDEKLNGAPSTVPPPGLFSPQ